MSQVGPLRFGALASVLGLAAASSSIFLLPMSILVLALTLAWLIRPDWRVLAAGMLNNLCEVKLPPQCGGLFLIGDNDTRPEPVAGFAKVCARLQERGLPFHVIRPPEGIKDFNDWLQALQRAAGNKRGVA